MFIDDSVELRLVQGTEWLHGQEENMSWTTVTRVLAIGGLCVGALTIAVPPAMACQMDGIPSPPAITTRTYRNPRLGFAFELPSNYRLMASQQGDRFQVWLLSPEEFDFLDCMAREQIGIGGVFGHLTMVSRPVAGHGYTLPQLVQQDFYQIDRFQMTHLSGRPVAVFSHYDPHDAIYLVSVAFMAPGNGNFVALTGEAGDPIFRQAMDTFRFQ